MRSLFLYTFLILLFSAVCFNIATAQIKPIDHEQIEEYISESSADYVVINFWATWCKPCIEELPYFDALNQAFPKKNIDVMLISMDFLNKLETKVIPFIKNKNIKSSVFILNVKSIDQFINAINSDWQGEIPATLVINKSSGRRKFIPSKLKKDKLHQLISTL